MFQALHRRLVGGQQVQNLRVKPQPAQPRPRSRSNKPHHAKRHRDFMAPKYPPRFRPCGCFPAASLRLVCAQNVTAAEAVRRKGPHAGTARRSGSAGCRRPLKPIRPAGNWISQLVRVVWAETSDSGVFANSMAHRPSSWLSITRSPPNSDNPRPAARGPGLPARANPGLRW